MARSASAEMVALDESRKAPALTGSDDVDAFLCRKDVAQNFVSRLRPVVASVAAQTDFPQHAYGSRTRFLEMTVHSFGHALRLDELHETELNGFISVLVYRFLLHHNARP